MLYCKEKMGEVRGSAIVELVERVTGEPCPCKQGVPCPLMPKPRDSADAVPVA